MNADVPSIVKQLSRYLRRHPDACDTPEGIARWWLVGDAGTPVTTVQAALDWLAGAGLVAAVRAADGRVRYRRVGSDPALDARLDAMAADPSAAGRPRRGLH